MKKKFTSTIIGIVALIVVIAGGTYAWWTSTSSNITVSFTVNGAGCSMNCTTTGGTNLVPVGNKTSGSVTSCNLKSTGSSLFAKFYLTPKTLPSTLKNTTFKWYFGTSSSAQILTGNFGSAVVGTPIPLNTNAVTVTTAGTAYYLYLWIDGTAGNNPLNMMYQSYQFEIHANCSDNAAGL